MVTKKVLKQYISLKNEVKETKEKIKSLEIQICQISKRLREIEVKKESVRDKVKGGMGGIQGFQIEGLPIREYQTKKSELMMKNILLNQRKSTLEILEYELLEKTNEIERFIMGIQDSQMRRIISLRFIENLSWNMVADRIGGNNTEDSIRKAFERFMKKI
ncbi:hypothetical protein B5F53_11890 [Blautia sp. An249]|uniref:hypothetical protein n=1 Tax=Blautia sp. An249 TaxID=1965603 RepID=UPI000B39F22A|nr:hypothetical protein [Blautia sp. An249]OUO77910.1 hypothetical protein B5F53_11890 [Blautia sp. An249]